MPNRINITATSKLARVSVIATVVFFVGCSPRKSESHKGNDLKPIEKVDAEPEPIEYRFDANCVANDEEPTESQLQSILESLSKSDNRYELKNRSPVDMNSSVFYGIQYISKLSDQRTTYEVSNLDHLINQIVASESVFVKGKKDISISGDGGLFARTHIEEYIFRSADCAKTAEKYLHWINKHGPWGGMYHKAPSEIILQDQTLYYVLSGGEFMRGYMPDIVSAIESSEE